MRVEDDLPSTSSLLALNVRISSRSHGKERAIPIILQITRGGEACAGSFSSAVVSTIQCLQCGMSMENMYSCNGISELESNERL